MVNPFHMPCLELCIPFNCCKCPVLNISQNQEVFHCPKIMHLLANRPGIDRNDTFPYPFIYFNSWNPCILMHIPEAWQRSPFRAEPPRIGPYRTSSPGGESLRMRRRSLLETLILRFFGISREPRTSRSHVTRALPSGLRFEVHVCKARPRSKGKWFAP